jgi:hypothetical protein
MGTILKLLGVWSGVSAAMGLLIGRVIAQVGDGGGSVVTGSIEAGGPAADLDRLVQIELTDIPRIRRAISDWVDDEMLVERMRGLQREADDIRERLDLDRRRATAIVSA